MTFAAVKMCSKNCGRKLRRNNRSGVCSPPWQPRTQGPARATTGRILTTTEAERRRELIESHQWLVHHWAHKWEAYHDFDDLVQEGNMGLLRAIEKFKPSRGVKFTSYATLWIKAFMGRLHQRAGLVRTADKSASVVSYDEIAPGEGGDETYLSRMEDTTLVPIDEQVQRAELAAAVQGALSRLSQRLSGLPGDVVRERLMRGEGPDATRLEQLGARHGVSRERVRQVEIRTRKLLASYLEPLKGAHGL